MAGNPGRAPGRIEVRADERSLTPYAGLAISWTGKPTINSEGNHFMKKYLFMPALAITFVSALAATASAAVAQPILGPKAYPYYQYGGLQGTKGFGQVNPRTI